MIKTKFLAGAALCALTLGVTATANAQSSRLYFAGYLGLNTHRDQPFEDSSTSVSGNVALNNATSFGGALGLRLNRNFRVEAELSYRNADLGDMDVNNFGTFGAGGEFKSTFSFLNLYYDLDVPWKIQPFIGAGVGYGWHSGEISNVAGVTTNWSEEASNFAYNVGGGLKYRVSPDMAFTGSYRYIDSLDLDFGDWDQDYSSHEFRIGLEWDLPVR